MWGGALLLKPPFALLTLGLAGYAFLARELIHGGGADGKIAWREVWRRLVIELAGVPVKVSERHQSGDWEALRDGIEPADLVLVAETGAPGLHEWWPSARMLGRAVDYIREQPNRYTKVAEFRTYSGKSFLLFRRRP